jgi:hypothetical protein
VSHPAEDPELDELDFVPIEEEPENEALDAIAEMALLLDRVQAARIAGA